MASQLSTFQIISSLSSEAVGLQKSVLLFVGVSSAVRSHHRNRRLTQTRRLVSTSLPLVSLLVSKSHKASASPESSERVALEIPRVRLQT